MIEIGENLSKVIIDFALLAMCIFLCWQIHKLVKND